MLNIFSDRLKSIPVAVLVTLLAFCISTISTGWGLAIGLQGTSELSPTATIFIGGALSLLVSFVGYITWTNIGRVSKEVTILLALLILPFGVAITSVSVFFSGAGMIYATSQSQLQRNLEARAVLEVTRPLDDFRISLANISESVAQVAEVAASQAALEASTGGSCVGVAPIVGEGPLFRWRMQTNAEASGFADQARVLLQEADDIVRSVHATEGSLQEKQRALTTAYQSARQLDADNRIARIQRWVSPLKTQLENGNVIFEGRSRTCGDPVLLAILTDLDTTLAQTSLELPVLPPEISEPSIFHAMIENAKILSSFRLEDITAGQELDTQTFSMLPITVVAIIIDLVGLMAAIMAGRLPPKFEYHEISYKQRLRWLANALRWDSGEKGAYFCVPVDGDLQVQVEANNVALSFGLRRIPSMMGISKAELAEVNEWEAQRLSQVSGGAERFKVYEFNKRLYDELIDIETRLRFETKFNYQNPPDLRNVERMEDYKKRKEVGHSF